MAEEEDRTAQKHMETNEMGVLYGICCGVDVHKKLPVICLRSGTETETRNLGTTTQELFGAAHWLRDNHCEMVAMESTASYWKPVYKCLRLC